jgi:hypothetical protein
MSQFEQQTNVNFFCKLAKSKLETSVSLNVVYTNAALKKQLFTTGTINLGVAKNHYKKRSAVASRQHQGKKKMWTNSHNCVNILVCDDRTDSKQN